MKDYDYILTDRCELLSGFVDRETVRYYNIEDCFDALIVKVSAYQAHGYKLTEIKNNKYYLNDPYGEIIRTLIITKKLRNQNENHN